MIALAQPATRFPGQYPAVTLELTSTAAGQQVPPGSPIQWSITAHLPPSSVQHLGLAALSVDLVQAIGNPRLFDIPPADGVPLEMIPFSRPQGVSNPGPGGVGTGYIGTQLGPANARNLVQIGGAQNTFGVAGVDIGQTTTVTTGIGQGAGGQVIVSGTFYAPAAAGTYLFTLENGMANALTQVRPPPQFSIVLLGRVTLTGSISFTIQCPPDWNGDGDVNSADISAFLTTWLDSVNSGHNAADYNGDGQVNSTDTSAFLTDWLQAVEHGC